MYSFLKVVLSFLFNIFFDINIIGNNEFEENKAYIFASNHGSVLDPILLAITCKNKPIHFIAKKELFKNPIFSKFLKILYAIPIDRDKMDFRGIKDSFNVLRDNKILGIFPEGTRVRDGKQVDTKNGIGMFACRSGADVVPITIVAYNNYRIFSRIDVIYSDIYCVQDDLKKKRIENYEKVSDEVMTIISKNKKESE